jgi:hypothetical protein
MKKLHVFRWLLAAALGALIPFTTQSVAGHGSGGGHGTGGGGGHGTGTGQAKGGHQAVVSHGLSHETGDHRFAPEDHFFRHHPRFSSGFNFVEFGFPYWWYPYDYVNYDYAPVYDYRFWQDLAMKVQSELARRGYYHGPIDGVIGSDSRQAIRGFQKAEGLPVTGLIDPHVLRALRVPVPRVSLRSG